MKVTRLKRKKPKRLSPCNREKKKRLNTVIRKPPTSYDPKSTENFERREEMILRNQRNRIDQNKTNQSEEMPE